MVSFFECGGEGVGASTEPLIARPIVRTHVKDSAGGCTCHIHSLIIEPLIIEHRYCHYIRGVGNTELSCFKRNVPEPF